VKLILLDINVIVYLFDASRKPIRFSKGRKKAFLFDAAKQSELLLRLREAVAAGRARVLITENLLGEMAEFSGSKGESALNLAAIRNEFFPLAANRILLSAFHRIPLEIRRGERLPLDDAYAPNNRARAVLELFDDPSTLAKWTEETKGQKLDYENMEKALRNETLAEWNQHEESGEEPEWSFEDWRRDWPRRVREWCIDHLKTEKVSLNLSDDESTWPDPRNIPSLWALVSIRLADLYQIIGKGSTTKKLGSMKYDLNHFADAAYADYFVTADSDLLARACLVATVSPSPNALHLVEFFEGVRSGEILG
jgi:hypothetical protein